VRLARRDKQRKDIIGKRLRFVSRQSETRK